MPLHKSAEKRLRQSDRKNARNRARKKELKVLIKNMQKLVDAGAPKPEVEVAYRSAVQKLDRLGIKNYIHANKASRKKSQLARILNEYGKAE
ncbi:MAG: 30S ribosomal protein S20 [Chlorobium sp.]|nr:30S ribosomal protein S20 [Chlorobium phaeovibrioides]NQU45479.1 30S ribosomal protein S20 [Chlorobium sp.]